MNRFPVVGVLGSGQQAFEPEASELGRWLAEIGVHLLTGGGQGVMLGVCRGYCSVPRRRGLSLGIIPAARDSVTNTYLGSWEGYPNPYVELPIVTHLHQGGGEGSGEMSRNHINILTSDVLIACPGGAGTSSEVHLAVSTYSRPIIAYLGDRSQIPDLPDTVRVVHDLENVQRFVLSILAESRGFKADD